MCNVALEDQDKKEQEKILFNVLTKKLPFRGVIIKRGSENMQQIYRRTPMPKYDFNKVMILIKLQSNLLK